MSEIKITPPEPPKIELTKTTEPPPSVSQAKAQALAAARAKRAVAAERKAPEGYRSLEHFLDAARDAVGRRSGGTLELARYLNVNESSVRRWLKREKTPLQPTIDAIAQWLKTKAAGL